MNYTLPRGTRDILPEETRLWQHIEQISKDIFQQFNYKEIRTPIFESSALFNRVIGEASDIIQKEMYTFTDKGNRELALRPEGTAPIARAYLTNHLNRQSGETKLFYQGPMFRYERPQAGRYRQFHQVGVENIGSSHPYSDAEVITMSYYLFKALGLKNIVIYINSVGSESCRPVIEARIKQFLSSNIDRLSDDLKKKYEKNPLKILDSKDDDLQTFLSGLPDLREALSRESKDHFNLVLEYLDCLGIPFEYKPTLVRGLDYYTETVFEVVSDELGAQNSICGGGRYNNLIADLGGKKTPAVGFAFGLERVAMLLESQQTSIPDRKLKLFVAPLGSEHQMSCIKISNQLRKSGHAVMMDYTKTDLNPQLKRASKCNVHYTLILGDNESESNSIMIKNMSTGQQELISLNELESYFSIKSKELLV